MNPLKRFLPVAGIGLLAVTFSGCDVFKTIGDYFKGSKDQKAVAQTAPSNQTTAPQVAPVNPNAIVQVDDWSLDAKDFQQRLDALKQAAPDFDPTTKENKKAIAEELVNQQLLVKEAEASGLGNTADIKTAVDEFRRTMLIRELANQLTKNITVSDEEAQDFYNKQKQYMVSPTAWHIRAIIVEDKDSASKILSDILAGADFAEQAKLHSKLPGAAENGGDVGFLTAEQIPFPELANEILTLKAGDVSKVFQGPDGFYVIKLEEKRGGDPLAFNDIKEQIKSNLLLQKQQDQMIKHTQELRGKSNVKINENLF